MEFLTSIITTLTAHYGWAGIALVVLMLGAFIAQICRYIVYARVAGFRLSRRTKIREQEPPVSVIVPIFSEDVDYLDSGLIALLTQEYYDFEVVAVYIGNDDNSGWVALADMCSQLGDSYWKVMSDGQAFFSNKVQSPKYYLDDTRYLYVSNGTLYYYNGSTAKQVAFTN